MVSDDLQGSLLQSPFQALNLETTQSTSGNAALMASPVVAVPPVQVLEVVVQDLVVGQFILPSFFSQQLMDVQ